MNLQTFAGAFFTFCSISIRVGSAQGDYMCVHNQQEFTDNGWLDDAGDLNWAADSSDLPGEIKDNLKGQYQDVFYFAYPTSTDNPFVRNPMSQWGSAGPAYVYLKYYAHNKASTSDYYILPEIITFYYDLIPGPAYTWKEELLEMKPGEEVELGATTLEAGNYLFVDTIIYTYGIPYDVSKDMEVVKALCPQEVGTTSTTVSLTDSSTLISSSLSTSSDLPTTTISLSSASDTSEDSTTELTTKSSSTLMSSSTEFTISSSTGSSTSSESASSSIATPSTSESTSTSPVSSSTLSDTTSTAPISSSPSSDSTLTSLISSSASSESTPALPTSSSILPISTTTPLISSSISFESTSSPSSTSPIPGGASTSAAITSSGTNGPSSPAIPSSPISSSPTTNIPVVPPGSPNSDGLAWYYIAMYSLLPLLALLVSGLCIYYCCRSRRSRPIKHKPLNNSPSNLSLKSFDITVEDHSASNNTTDLAKGAPVVSQSRNPLATPNVYSLSPPQQNSEIPAHPHTSLSIADARFRRGSNLSAISTASTYTGVKEPDWIIPRLIRE